MNQSDADERLDRIVATARQMAGSIVVRGGSAQFAEEHAAAIEADADAIRKGAE